MMENQYAMNKGIGIVIELWDGVDSTFCLEDVVKECVINIVVKNMLIFILFFIYFQT